MSNNLHANTILTALQRIEGTMDWGFVTLRLYKDGSGKVIREPLGINKEIFSFDDLDEFLERSDRLMGEPVTNLSINPEKIVYKNKHFMIVDISEEE